MPDLHGDERDDRFDFAGSAPPFHKCACGTFSTIVPCAACAEKALDADELEADRRRYEAAMMRCIPPESRWATLDSPELSSRVSLRNVRTQAVDGSSSFAAADVQEAARRVLAHPAWVLFTGPARTGKTSLSVACLRARGRGLFVAAGDLAVARSQYSLGEGEAPLVAKCVRARLLLLDDLGEENPANSAIPYVLKTRWRRNLATWITTGLTRDEIASRYGEGLVGRLFEPPRAFVLPFTTRAR